MAAPSAKKGHSESPVFQLAPSATGTLSVKRGSEKKSGKAPAPTHHRLVLVAAGASWAEALKHLDIAPLRLPKHLENHAALKGERGAKLALHGETSVFFYGIGKPELFNEQEAADFGEACGQFIVHENVTELTVHFPVELDHPIVNVNFLKGLGLAGLRYQELKSTPPSQQTRLTRVLVAAHGTGVPSQQELDELAPLVQAIGFARILGELPPAIASPTGVVESFKKAANKKIEIEVWDEKRIAREKMGLLQAVSQGSAWLTPPRFLIARYGKQFRSKRPTLYLVGKGITFDTGGINLKTGDWQMLLSMRRDMCGAAAVLGALLAISEIGLELNVVAVTPLTTNSIGSRAVLPGDIVRSYSGKTVEIMNTDAEGRLILADALHYALQQKADYIVDVATLTGACAVALGGYHSGLFANDDDFGHRLLTASQLAGEPAWPMPLSPRYGEELKSGLADLANMGKSREGGAQIGAKFLENFVGKTPWVHLDIAGTHDIVGPAAAGAGFKAAGRMVHTLVEVARSFVLTP